MDDQGIRERLRAWARSAGCRLCVLFGSRAGGGPVVEGDVDLAVWFSPLPSPERRLGIIGEIQDAAGAMPVDLLFLHPGIDPVVRFEIFRGGEPLFEERPGLFVDEKVRALMLYEDALPFRRARRERVREMARRDRP